MPQVKGLTFADARAYLTARGGPEAWERLRKALTPADRTLLDEVIAVGWYDIDTHVRMLESMPVALGKSMPETMHDYARFSAERHVSRVYRVLFLVANPAMVLEKSGEYWSRFYDTGEWKVSRDTEKRVHGDLFSFARPTAAFCEFLTTYCGCLFERVGCKDVRTSHPRCRVRGDTMCTYTVEWR
ncbi:MAG: hypothetical protein ACXVEF_14345 [Polyangiales bacterium]